jgi:mono/diheme cytochrome c family protein
MPTQRFSNKRALGLTIALLLGAAVVLTACGGEAATPCPEVECPECPEVECPECPEAVCPEPAVEVPFEDLWASSGHADAEAEAFVHWDEDDPAEVPTGCAKCHSTPGYLDFLGLDGTEAGTVDNAAEIGTTVTCVACHNEATVVKDSVVFPSGMEVTGLGDESRCMECHQGRASTTSVNDAIAEAGVADDDTASEELGFVNIHYYAAAATQYGTLAMGGYQYEGKAYDAKFAHVEGFDTCFSCHDPHTLEIKVESCAECHTGVASKDDLKNARLAGSMVDYDGDGDVTEGVYYEIEGLQGILYQAIQAYASDAGAPIVYDAGAYPYFLTEDGERYGNWTPRLLKAAYNYQTSVKDPGAFAHGGKYIIQLLYDSIEDLNADLVAGLSRIDAGHFAGSQEAFRHWDEDGEVSSSCAKCHSATGLPTFLKEGVSVSEPVSNGFLCTTCHDSLPEFTRYEVAEVEFPSGAKLDTGNPDSNLCLNCHQGRESTVSVNRAIEGLAADAVSEDLGFRNVHYFAAGATLFGTEAQGAYEYAGKTYNGRFAHVEGFDSCIQCHGAHGLEVKFEACGTCHAGAEEPEDIRMDATDFDGDGDTEEGIAGEVETLREALYAAIQSYATDVVGTGIVYDAHSHPYFFTEDGERYGTWTPRLLQAAYNYQYATKDTGGFAHNGKYVLQVLYDSLADIGGDTAGMVRP